MFSNTTGDNILKISAVRVFRHTRSSCFSVFLGNSRLGSLVSFVQCHTRDWQATKEAGGRTKDRRDVDVKKIPPFCISSKAKNCGVRTDFRRKSDREFPMLTATTKHACSLVRALREQPFVTRDTQTNKYTRAAISWLVIMNSMMKHTNDQKIALITLKISIILQRIRRYRFLYNFDGPILERSGMYVVTKDYCLYFWWFVWTDVPCTCAS